MPLTPYIETLSSTKETRDKKAAPQKAATQKKRGELKVAELDEKISSLEQKVFDLASKETLDFDAIIEAQDELALATRRKAQFETIILELFPA